MSDQDIDHFDYHGFIDFAHRMLSNGTCMKIECPDYRHHEGPTIANDRCKACFKERTGK